MDAFEEIYRRNLWKGRDSVSGSGSTLPGTQALRAQLPRLLHRYNVTSIVDAPCGDFHWMRETALGDCEYTGVDIVSEVVDAAARQHSAANRRFLCLDISRDVLPRADLILCRDCLVHFSYSDIFQTLRKFKESGAEFLLTTTFPAQTFNANCPTGHWRPLNLQRPPFNLPEPLCELREQPDATGYFSDKALALWKVSSIPL
jgi:SAM-dependent methyltransferase